MPQLLSASSSSSPPSLNWWSTAKDRTSSASSPSNFISLCRLLMRPGKGAGIFCGNLEKWLICSFLWFWSMRCCWFWWWTCLNGQGCVSSLRSYENPSWPKAAKVEPLPWGSQCSGNWAAIRPNWWSFQRILRGRQDCPGLTVPWWLKS